MRAIVLVVCVGCFNDSHAHCLALCSDLAMLVVTTGVPSTSLTNGTIRICNDVTACSSLVLTSSSGTATGNFDASIDMQSGADGNALVTIYIRNEDSVLRYRDGDTWNVTIADATGGVLFDATAVATYTFAGPDCEGHMCPQLALDLP